MIRCIGCGVVLQTENKEELGYIPKEKMESGSLCERCFRIRHYNDVKKVDVLSNEEIVKQVNKGKFYAFFLIDILNISQDVVDTYNNIKNPKCMFISKVDILPKSIKKEKIKSWLRKVYGIKEDIVFISSVKRFNIHALEHILEENKMRDGCLLGFTNAGKSTLVNALLNNPSITTNCLPNTTIDFIKIELNNGYFLYDAPGFQYQNLLYNIEDIQLIKRINLKDVIKPITYQLKKGTGIVIEEYLRITCNSNVCNLTFYVSPSLKIQKIYEKNEILKNKKKTSLIIKKDEDIVLKGLGFVTFKSDTHIDIYEENPNQIEKRKSMFGGSSIE